VLFSLALPYNLVYNNITRRKSQMGRMRNSQTEKRIPRQVLLSENDIALSKRMIADDDSEFSPLIRRLLREEAVRRGYIAESQTAIVTQEN
jgi:hypothetical protein